MRGRLAAAIVLCSALASTYLFGQTSYVWTNQFPTLLTSGDLNRGLNWDVNGPLGAGGFDLGGVPRPDFQDGVTWGDEMLFDGRTTNALLVTQNGGSQANGAGSGQPYGLRVHLSANQTNSVRIISPVSVSGGIRMNYFLVDAGAGSLHIGDHTTNVLDIVGGVLNGQIFGFTNNSSTPAVLNEDVRFRMGGAGAHAHIFSGSGDWIVNNHMRSANSSSIIVQKFGTGTMTWTGTNVGAQAANWFDQLGTPITIGEGTMIWKTSDLVSAPGSGNPNIVNNAAWKYDVQPAPGLVTGPGQVLGNISGTGSFEMHAGTLTFGGANTFSGPINLTGGELIAGSIENAGVSGPLGQGVTISFNGGTLGWSPVNAFDYSARFSTAPNQAYILDTGGSSPTLSTGLSSSGGTLTKVGGGTLTLTSPSTYTGQTTVSAGELLFQSTKSGNANITVADGAALGVYENNSQITPSTLTLGTSTGVTLEFNNVTNHTLPTLAPNTLVSGGMVTINVNSGRFFAIGETFALLRWTNGPAPATGLAFLAGAGGHLTTNLNEIDLVIDDPPYIWTAAANTIWNTTSIDWMRSGSPVTWVNGHYALLDDSSGQGAVTLSGIITPTNTSINNADVSYVINNSAGNVIGGGGSVTKTGNGTLTLPGGANTYTGVTTIGGGIVTVNVLANGGAPSDIGAASSASGNILLNGGTLQYTGPGISIDRLFSLGTAGGTIDNESVAPLVFNNTGAVGMSGNGPRTLTLTGPLVDTNTLACSLTNHPAGTSLIKSGPGLWVLTGTNTYAGGTSLQGGSLQIGGANGGLGNGNVSTAAGTSIDFQRTGTLLVPGAINGSCSVSSDGSGTLILANNNGYTGGTTINAGTLQIGNGGGTGSLFVNGAIVNNSLLVFNTSGSFAYQAAGIISGPGNVIFQGGGSIKAIGNNSYTGWTRIDANTTFFCREGQDGFLLSSIVTNNGTLRIVSQDAAFSYIGNIVGSGRVQIGANNVNVGTMTLTGTNTYTGGTFIGDNTLVLGDGSNAGRGAIAGNVQFVNNFTIGQDNPRTLTFNRPDDFTFGGTITTNFTSPQSNLGIVQQNGGLSGTGTLTLTGNNTYGGGTVVAGGFVVIGNGGGSGSVGFGPVTLSSGNPLLINRSGSLSIPGAITGSGGVTVIGSGTVTLGGTNGYIGSTVVSNGTLIVQKGIIGGDLSVEGGTYVAGDYGTVITNTIAGNMNIDSGTVVASLNKASPQSNTVYSAGIAVTATGGTLKLFNIGPALVPGEKYFIFGTPVVGGALMKIISPGFTVSSSLGVDGAVTITGVQPTTRPPLTLTTAGNQLVLSWPTNWIGSHLQGQTNALPNGIRTNWTTIPGTDLVNGYTNTINRTNGSVFFRLIFQ